MEEKTEKPTLKMCTGCGEQPGIWNLRARTKFLCEKCRMKLEWGTE